MQSPDQSRPQGKENERSPHVERPDHSQGCLTTRPPAAGSSSNSGFTSWGLISRRVLTILRTFQVALVVRNPPANAGDLRDMGSIPGSGRSPGERNGYSLQYSCLKNPHGQRSLEGCSPWGHIESNMAEQLTFSSWVNSKNSSHSPTAFSGVTRTSPLPPPHDNPFIFKSSCSF